MKTNKQEAAQTKSSESFVELSDSDLAAVHGGIVIGSRLDEVGIVIGSFDPGNIIRIPGLRP